VDLKDSLSEAYQLEVLLNSLSFDRYQKEFWDFITSIFLYRAKRECLLANSDQCPNIIYLHLI